MSLIPVAPTLGSLFVQSWQIYRAHLFPLLGLTLVLLVPALLLSLSGVDQGESVVFFLLMRLLEAGATPGTALTTVHGRFSHWEDFTPIGQSHRPTTSARWNPTILADNPWILWIDGTDTAERCIGDALAQ